MSPLIRSLSESYRTVTIDAAAPAWRRMLAFAGPGYLVAVGYMDPGNWATSLGGGSAFGYTLLSVILLASLMAMLLQALSARLGIAAGLDLAQACRQSFSKPVNAVLWVLCELAICATDLAEVIGTAIALKLLFDIPILPGIIITALDVFLLLWLQKWGFRKLEAFVVSLLLVIVACYGYNLFLSTPDWGGVVQGFVPTTELFSNTEMLYLGIGILGATVMPHNLYLHSSIVQTRCYAETNKGRGEAIRFATIDSTVALAFALLINAAILILASAAFHANGYTEVADLEDAYKLIAPLLGTALASIAFGVALLACGLNSTVTATMAGQIVMEGFLNLQIAPWLRRLITRIVAIVPALLVVGYYGEGSLGKLLVFSQVILSLQLPFAVVPLLMFTRNKKLMGDFVAPRWLQAAGGLSAVLIIVLNAKLVWDFIA